MKSFLVAGLLALLACGGGKARERDAQCLSARTAMAGLVRLEEKQLAIAIPTQPPVERHVAEPSQDADAELIETSRAMLGDVQADLAELDLAEETSRANLSRPRTQLLENLAKSFESGADPQVAVTSATSYLDEKAAEHATYAKSLTELAARTKALGQRIDDKIADPKTSEHTRALLTAQDQTTRALADTLAALIGRASGNPDSGIRAALAAVTAKCATK